MAEDDKCKEISILSDGWHYNNIRTVLLNKCAKLREYIKLIFRMLF